MQTVSYIRIYLQANKPSKKCYIPKTCKKEI